jgi:MipA family protein
MKPTLALLALASLSAAAASAQETLDGFSLGVIAAATDSPYIGEDQTASVLPLISYSSDAFSISFPQGLRVTLFCQDRLRFSAILQPRLSVLADPDSAELAGIDREHTLDAGVQLDFDFSETTGLLGKAVTETTGEHHGQEVTLAVRQRLFLGQVPLMLDAGLKWQSDELSNYLYGVRDSEATGTRATYAPGEVVIPYLSLGSAIPISDKARIIGAVRVDFVPKEISDSQSSTRR